MNKTEFIRALIDKTGYSEERCSQINAILEDNFIIGKQHKQELVDKFQRQLKMDGKEAEDLYETVMGLIGSELKEKIKHPLSFGR